MGLPLLLPSTSSSSSSGSAGFNPNAFGTLANWYKAGYGKYSDAGTTPSVLNDPVRQWNDFQGTANVSQATLGNRPTDKTTYLDFVSASNQDIRSANNVNAGAFGGQNGTIVVDFYLNSTGAFGIASRDDFRGGWNFGHFLGAGGLYATTWNGGGYDTTAAGNYSAAAWRQAVLRYTHGSTKLEIFIDGTLAVSNTSRTIATPSIFNGLFIGSTIGGLSNLDGRIGQFACYPSTAISDAAVAAWYLQKTT